MCELKFFLVLKRIIVYWELFGLLGFGCWVFIVYVVGNDDGGD